MPQHINLWVKVAKEDIQTLIALTLVNMGGHTLHKGAGLAS